MIESEEMAAEKEDKKPPKPPKPNKVYPPWEEPLLTIQDKYRLALVEIKRLQGRIDILTKKHNEMTEKIDA